MLFPLLRPTMLLVALGWLAFPVARRLEAEPTEQPKFTHAQRQFFLAEVQPLLKMKCLGCHGDGDEIASEFDMRSRVGAIAGGELGAGATPGEPEQSPLFTAVLRTGDLAMPPKERNKLTPEEVDLLRRWVADGMPWALPGEKLSAAAAGRQDGIAVATSGGLSPDWTNRRYDPADVWAFFPVRPVDPPKVTVDGREVTHPIDAFLYRKLQQQNLKTAGDADPAVWLRRATFDLTGLPPTPEEVDAFAERAGRSDRNGVPAAAAEAVIDRLLQSPHYGERMAQHWLDVVRYADTAGFANDWERPHAWRYRDWVVRSFNNDKPYDRFVVEQIAGDELRDLPPSEAKIAVGMLRMGPWEHTGMSVAAVTRQQYLDDVTDIVGIAFLAQGMSCCKCHDHKFDPLPTRDYYRLQAVFSTVQFDEAAAPFLPEENTSSFARHRKVVERLADAEDWMQIQGEKLDSARRVKKKRDDYMRLAKQRFDAKALSVKNSGAPTVRILTGGSLESPGEEVGPGVPSAVRFSAVLFNGEPSAANEHQIPTGASGRRLALARWIADPRNPLTARVMVNRVWQMHFGRGLVGTSNSFGKMGDKPTHPELLDWLATWFVEHDWSIKQLHRLIMTSDAYRRGGRHPRPEAVAEADPKNQLLAYFSPRRLTAEELRDAMLSATGELSKEMGGPGVFPEINWEVALQPRHIMGSVAPTYQPSPARRDRHRRSLYAFRIRTLADPMQEVFNRPGPDAACPRRDETTVTPQVFALFNSRRVQARSIALARRLEQAHDQPAGRIDAAFRLLLGRRPSKQERERCLDHVAAMTRRHEEHPPVKTPLPVAVSREMVDEMTGRTFRWEEKLHNLLDYERRPHARRRRPPRPAALPNSALVLMNANEFVYVY